MTWKLEDTLTRQLLGELSSYWVRDQCFDDFVHPRPGNPMQKSTRTQSNDHSFLFQFRQRCVGHVTEHDHIEGKHVTYGTSFCPTPSVNERCNCGSLGTIRRLRRDSSGSSEMLGRVREKIFCARCLDPVRCHPRPDAKSVPTNWLSPQRRRSRRTTRKMARVVRNKRPCRDWRDYTKIWGTPRISCWLNF